MSLVLARAGAFPLLLGRDAEKLESVAERIGRFGGKAAGTVICDLTNSASCASAAEAILTGHPGCDAIIHNGSLWQGHKFRNNSPEDIAAVINSTVTGAMQLTRHLLPHFESLPRADILTIVSATGLPHVLLRSSSVAFKAAKAAQDAFVQGLAEETRATPVRVSAIHPGFIRDAAPDEPGWDDARRFDDPLTDREVTDAVLFMLNLPPSVAVRSMVIERNTDYQLWPNAGEDGFDGGQP